MDHGIILAFLNRRWGHDLSPEMSWLNFGLRLLDFSSGATTEPVKPRAGSLIAFSGVSIRDFARCTRTGPCRPWNFGLCVGFALIRR